MCFNFQISCSITYVVCCFPGSNGRFVGGLVGGRATQSVSLLDLYFYESRFLSVPTQMCLFSQVLVVPKLCVYNFIDVRLCCNAVHACVILIWILSIFHIGVEGQYVPSNTGSVMMYWLWL